LDILLIRIRENPGKKKKFRKEKTDQVNYDGGMNREWGVKRRLDKKGESTQESHAFRRVGKAGETAERKE